MYFCIVMYVRMKPIIENVGWEFNPLAVELDLEMLRGRSEYKLAFDCKKRAELLL